MSKILFFIATFFATTLVLSQQVTTVAGSTYGYIDGLGLQAQFNNPSGICVDDAGYIYVADKSNNRIRKIDQSNNNAVTTIAGSGAEGFADGVGTNAIFAAPTGICIDSQGNLYVTDFWNFKIRKITPAGVVTTVAGTTQGYTDGNVTIAQFGYLAGICVDTQGNLYVADGGNNRIRKITPTGVVSTVAGSTSGYQDGIGTNSKFDYPSGICIDPSNNLFITETFGQKIRKINSFGIVSTVAGSTLGYADGQGTSAQFSMATGICIDNFGNIFVTDSFNNRIRKITPSGLVSTYSGSVYGYIDGSITDALYKNPWDICRDLIGNLYIAELDTDKIRKIETNLNIETVTFESSILYPNPNNGNFRINNLQSGIIEVYDVLGQLVFTKSNVQSETEIKSELKKGIYLVEIINEDGKTVTQKMVVE